MTVRLAYLAEGKLYLRDGAQGAAARLIESPFVQQQLDRAAQTRQRHEWKSDNNMLWGGFSSSPVGRVAGAIDGDHRLVRMTALSRGPAASQILYALQSGTVGGLFVWDDADRSERRIFHRNQFAARDLSVHPESGKLAMSVMSDAGTSNIATMDAAGKGLREITEGDSTDEAPSWIPPAACGGREALVYQSAGVGRNAMGAPVGKSPYAVLRLDFDRGDVETLLEDEQTDFLLPKVAENGDLYYIRRPYQAGTAPASPLKVLLDIVLFPFRLVMAFVHFFDWFSMVFRRKPLLTASGPKKEADSRYMMLWGKLVDAEKAMNKGSGKADRPLLPADWELVRQSRDGQQKVLATNVGSYDLCSDGSIVFTDGSGVYRIDETGASTRLCSGKLIERVIAVRPDAVATPTGDRS